MPFFKKKYVPELISLHIPKTAGTSFRHVLKSVYGKDAVIRLDIRHGNVEVNSHKYNSDELPSAKVLHGHFVYNDLIEKFEINQNIKKITWLRHPVQRVLSNYYYLESRLKTILNEEDRGLNILKKMQRTLLEYASDDKNRNRQTKFLTGITLNQLDFVGLTENFNSDLAEAAQVLGWPKIPKPLQINKTLFKKGSIPVELYNEISDLNSDDMKLYNSALKLKNLPTQ